VLVMALGDGSAGLVGARVPSFSWSLLGQRRSLAGTATMALVSLGVLATLAASLPAGPSAPVVVSIAAGAALLEQIGWLGVDNLTVPLAVAWLWQRFGG
jgi:phytol kinase